MKRLTVQSAPLQKAEFCERPNRFLVRCRIGKGRTIRAFLPNPGRLQELLLPGKPLYIARDARASSTRKTRFTVMAVERDEVPVFLHTHMTNHAVRLLLDHQRVPGLEKARVIRSEIPVGRSRFDFLLGEGRKKFYMEVKSVTLFGNGIAMFPDAITERGRRHLLELAELSQSGSPAVILFLVHTPNVRWFMPDYHTDLQFSRTLLDVRRQLRIMPVAVRWGKDLSLVGKGRLLPVPWGYLEKEAADRGAYLLILRLTRRQSIRVGRLGMFAFEKGYYVYAGSAMKGLSARIARHKRRRKTYHWHIDYLREKATECVALPIRSSRRLECKIAQALSNQAAPALPGFGSSDCRCATHLYLWEGNPLNHAGFHSLLQRFRMVKP